MIMKQLELHRYCNWLQAAK